MFIPVIPEIMERLQVANQISEIHDEVIFCQLNDKINDIYGFFYAVSQFISPIIGSKLYVLYGARSACDLVALMNVILGIIFFVFNCGPFVF